jgi:hypothetical protein
MRLQKLDIIFPTNLHGTVNFININLRIRVTEEMNSLCVVPTYELKTEELYDKYPDISLRRAETTGRVDTPS